MSIQNELSSDIAVALLTGEKKSAAELSKLKEVILTVHDTLTELTPHSRRRSFGKPRNRSEKGSPEPNE